MKELKTSLLVVIKGNSKQEMRALTTSGRTEVQLERDVVTLTLMTSEAKR